MRRVAIVRPETAGMIGLHFLCVAKRSCKSVHAYDGWMSFAKSNILPLIFKSIMSLLKYRMSLGATTWLENMKYIFV